MTSGFASRADEIVFAAGVLLSRSRTGCAEAPFADDHLDRLQDELDAFVAERGWSRFHTTDTLARALAVELVEFALSADENDAIRELSDILSYLVLFSYRIGMEVNLEPIPGHPHESDNLALDALTAAQRLLEASRFAEYVSAAWLVEDVLRAAGTAYDVDVAANARRKLRETARKYPVLRSEIIKGYLAHLDLKVANASDPLERAARHLERVHWQPTTSQVTERKAILVAELIDAREGRLRAKYGAETSRYRPLIEHMRKVVSAHPDPAAIPEDATAISNLIDLAVSAARACFQRGRRSLGLAILREAALLTEQHLEMCFLAWQSVGENAFAELGGDEVLSADAKAFCSRLEAGYYRDALGDLSSEPVTHLGKPRLAIVVSEDLDKFDLFSRLGDTTYFIGRIKNPQLAVSLAQGRKDFLPSMYALLEHLVKLGKDIRAFYLDGVKVRVSSDRVFGPAIDTFFFIRGLDRFIDGHGMFPSFGRIVELGAGSGAILYTLARRLSDASRGTAIHAIATDISRHAIAHCKELFSDLIEREEISFTTINDGQSLSRVRECYGTGSVDILLVNPPYIPRAFLEQVISEGRPVNSESLRNALESYLRSASFDTRPPETSEDIVHRGTEDLDLYIQALLYEGPKLLDEAAGIMFLLTSSTSEDVVASMLRRSPLEAVAIDHRANVPLDIPELTSGGLRIELLDLPGVTFDITDDRCPLRHSLTVYALFHPGGVWSRRLSDATCRLT